ncbi:MAG TPA: thiamine pyrophosphate-binding protein [Actinomycetota bacterium]|nr:thiamine pyrophosphate-binding protein [Actinomycetota bacterium]
MTRYGSDLVVDLLRARGIRYASLNPGSSFRGLHDSIVNHGGNEPELILCPHEKVAVGLAHGYAKASGEPMAAILHDVVGLLHGAMGIYYAFIDRAPVLVLGGAGPMDTTRRRPNIDWIHSANVQGNAVRDFTKWDDQPATIPSIPGSLLRALRVATAEPSGPVYVALDAGLQEDEAPEDLVVPDPATFATPSSIGAEPAALRRLAETLVAAERPVIVPGYVGRDPGAFELLPQLAELLGAGVVDTGIRLNVPNRHPLTVTGTDAVEHADLVFFVDVKDMGKPTQRLESSTRTIRSRVPEGARVVDLGFNDIGISAWSHDFAQLLPTDLEVTGDAAAALPALVELVRTGVEGEDAARAGTRTRRREEVEALHDRTWGDWAERARAAAEETPVSTARLAAGVWEAIREHDWVLTAGTASDWALRLWDFDRPYRHAGRSLGTATQIGISLGVGLAHRDAGRLVVDLQPDGDLMFDLGALWVASYHRIPMLVVMFNNRAYYNDWEHQERIARLRETPIENSWIGMEIDRPAPDFAGIARSLGWHAEGPIERPDDLSDALSRAVAVVTEDRKPALVDVVCQRR